MAAPFTTAFRRFVRADGPEQRAQARDLLARDIPWPKWLEAFNVLHGREPETEARAAGVLAAAAGRRKRAGEAARFRLLEGRGLQRAGSPQDAATSLLRAAHELRVNDDALRAGQAEVLAVDALAHAGRIQEALDLARQTGRRLRGPMAKLWRQVLAVNRANALRLGGDLKQAVRTYERAAKALEQAGETHTAAVALGNAGTALMDAGDARGALRRFEAARANFEAAGLSDMVLEMDYNRAAALVRAGRLGEGLSALEALEGEHRRRGLPRRQALCSMDLADAFLRAGDQEAAEAKALEAAAGFSKARALAERVEALWLAAAAAAEDAPGRAAQHMVRARSAALRVGRPALGLRCDVLRADLVVRAGRPFPGRSVATIKRQAVAMGQFDVACECLLLQGHAALRRHRWQEALGRFRDPLLRRAGRPWTHIAARTGEALAESGQGRITPALRHLRAVNRDLDAMRAELPGAWLRAAFVRQRLDPYLARVELLLKRGRKEDRREAEALLDVLAARRFLERQQAWGGAAPSDALRARLEAIYDRLARSEGPTRGLAAPLRLGLEREAEELEREVAEAWRRAERGRRPGPTVATARPSVAPVGALVTAVHVWLRGNELRGLVRRGDDIGSAVSLGSTTAIRDQVRMLSFHEDRARRSPGAGSALALGLENLAEEVLEPLDPLHFGRSVKLVLDSRVPELPWHLLPVDGRPLAARAALLRVPSMRVWGTRVRRGQGVTVIALGEEGLPGIEEEAAGIAELHEDTRLVAGSDATRAAVRDALSERDVVHLAGHGYDAEEAPGLGGVRVADGWFGALDVPERVTARLVVLAACRTGRRRSKAGRAWGGLPEALLAAGARTVLWTAADVDDTLTARLMRSFHARRARTSVPKALGGAIDSLVREQGHPAGLLAFHLSGLPS